ncbi:MAG TPA: SpoIID/LytB domain-containing protein [Gaiellaceae bacterium]|nr:SpoIID/LytB domain-containing protein [Gaiellaceae bacterium]
MGRFAVVLAGVVALALAGLASAVLAAHASGTTTTTASTTTGLSTPPPATVVSTAPTVLAFSGHGWGHGLGMSQWGAYGYAQHGWTYDKILAHYYTGTTLGTAKVATVRVLIASEKNPALTSLVPWTVTDAAGAKAQLAAGDLKLTPALSLADQPALKPPLTFSAAQPLLVDGHAYRGKLVLSLDGKLVDVVDVVGLEQYVKGVVPSEMPSSWSPEALKAQAVASRSYALANVAKGRAYDLFGDERSQVYGGVAAEVPSTDAAVDATKGQVVMYAGKVADTLFFSSSGGRTASALESTGVNVPYLVPVADPYDSIAPYHDWGPVLFDAAALAKQLKLSAPIIGMQAVNGPSGRVKNVTVSSSDDSAQTITGNQLRTLLDLRSTWFTPALLQLLPSAKAMTYGGAVSLTGLVRGAQGVSLEAKTATTDWTPVGALIPDESGAFSTVLKPAVSTSYRLVWGNVRAGLAKVTVAARVAATVTATAVQGTLRPAAAGAAVELQQQAGGTWTTLSSTVTDSSGAWTFGGALQPGTYRVRCAPGHGIAAGVSPSFTAQ